MPESRRVSALTSGVNPASIKHYDRTVFRGRNQELSKNQAGMSLYEALACATSKEDTIQVVC